MSTNYFDLVKGNLTKKRCNFHYFSRLNPKRLIQTL